MRVIFWAGDSTNTCNKAHRFPQTGIAQAFDRFTAPDVVIYDHAVNGRSTKSFIDQGRLATIYDEIRKGDFLFIQFAHNDEKETDPDRYTDPDTTFIENLGKFVN
ncbi:MAG: GDSL family lipase, partial [Lachnospiraceae bacterium]|nr:GDSL family lipase [Lachnospiraceae bacterium]